ncbi:MAG: hypothetical protein ACO3CR_06180 [Solirubrobacterales bacterium]
MVRLSRKERGLRLPLARLSGAMLAGAIWLSGCGGDDGSPRQADRAEIEALVAEINTAVAERDAAAWCSVFTPASVAETFGSPARCRTETEKVIAGSDQSRRLRITGVSFEGEDAARVRFSGTAGEANLTRVDGEWYLDLLQEVEVEPAPAGDEGTGAP